MKRLSTLDSPELVRGLCSGKIAVIRTDTLYGLVASALDQVAVQKIYALKQRDHSKACIVLIANESQLIVGTAIDETHRTLMKKYWPGSTTLVLAATAMAPRYITRGNTSIAYRQVPPGTELAELIERVGPLVAPSANPETLPPASTIVQAEAYFGETVDFYVDGGEVAPTVGPSRIITLDDQGREVRLR